VKNRDKLSRNYFAQVKEPDEQVLEFVLPVSDPEENGDNSFKTFPAPHWGQLKSSSSFFIICSISNLC
jgi:hypothetical protein